MDVIKARFTALTQTAESFDRTAGAATESLHTLNAGLSALRAVWAGDARGAFDAHFAEWFAAAGRMRDNLSELGALVDTVHDNYRSADQAGARIWHGHADLTRVGGATVAMSAGQPGEVGKVEVTLEDLRSVAKVFADLQQRMIDAVNRAAPVLAGTGGMAGDDPVLGRWREVYDPFAQVVCMALRAVILSLGAISLGLTETGNHYVDAENANTPPDQGPPLERLPDLGVETEITIAEPPSSTGPGPEYVPEMVAEYWPNGYPDRLRTAAQGWGILGGELLNVAGQADLVFRSLFESSSGAAFDAMKAYWSSMYRPAEPCDSGGGGLINLVEHTLNNLSGSCDKMALLIERTKQQVAGAVEEASDDLAMFSELADALDIWLTRGASQLVVNIGILALAGGYIEIYRDEYLSALDGQVKAFPTTQFTALHTLALITPHLAAARDRFAQVEDTIGDSLPEDEQRKRDLITEAQAQGHKIDPDQVVYIDKDPNGRIVWLEEGNPQSGLEHILVRHEKEFVDKGIPRERIAELVHRAATEGEYTGYMQGKGRPIFKVQFGGNTYYVAVQIGSNGYIVGANLRSSTDPFAGANPDPRAGEPGYRGW